MGPRSAGLGIIVTRQKDWTPNYQDNLRAKLGLIPRVVPGRGPSVRGGLGGETFPREVRGTADPSTAVGMTKGRVALPFDTGYWDRGTAGPSTSLRSGPTAGRDRRDDTSVWGWGLEGKFGRSERRTADPSASPDFLSTVAASVNCVWFSLERTT